MSCAPTPCPPSSPPDPQPRDTWDIPPPSNCAQGGTFYNTPQTYVNTCPVGSPTPPISVTIPAFTYSSIISQDDADEQAMLAAQEQADAERELAPCASAESAFLITEDDDFLVTEDDDFIVT